MKVVGIIGGLGPGATSEFYLKVLSYCYEVDKKNRPPILIWSVPINFELEKNFIVGSVGGRKYLPHLRRAAERLEKAGADFLVMPCNSMHVFVDDLKKSTRLPILHIAEESVDFIVSKKVKRIGILATSNTLQGEIYQGRLSARGVDFVLPEVEDQKKLDFFISRVVSGQNKDDIRELTWMINKFHRKGVEKILLACTDLKGVDSGNGKIYDTTEILARATARKILNRRF